MGDGATEGLELNACTELGRPASIGLSSRDLTEAAISKHRTGDSELRVVGNVIQIALQVEPCRFQNVKSEAAAETDVKVVVAWTIDVVRSSPGQIAEGIGRCVDERVGVYVGIRW